MESRRDRMATRPEAPRTLTPEQKIRISIFTIGGGMMAMIAGLIYIATLIDKEIDEVSNSRDITRNNEVSSISLHNHHVFQYTPRTVMLNRGTDMSMNLLDKDTRAAINEIEEVCGRRSAMPAVESSGQGRGQYFTSVFIDTDETGCVEKLRFAKG